MVKKRKVCSLKSQRHFFDALRHRDHGMRGSAELLEGLADLGCPASMVAAHLDTYAETVIEWRAHDVQLPVIIWDILLDLAKVVIDIGEARESLKRKREIMSSDCACAKCMRRRAGMTDRTLGDVYAEILGMS